MRLQCAFRRCRGSSQTESPVEGVQSKADDRKQCSTVSFVIISRPPSIPGDTLKRSHSEQVRQPDIQYRLHFSRSQWTQTAGLNIIPEQNQTKQGGIVPSFSVKW